MGLSLQYDISKSRPEVSILYKRATSTHARVVLYIQACFIL
jgi:hypothetical protein